ncbi:MAG: hypothetical protein JXO22_17205 [Phycisphaerae bacterium]|nr:hypothetical protein [Phycisphaerae bacterium]
MPKTTKSHEPLVRHRWLYALPELELPAMVDCAGQRYDHVSTFKHDFFAATGLYRGPDGLAVLKHGRTNDFITILNGWTGRFLTKREVRIYREVHGLSGVPRLIGTVGNSAFMHEFVPGHPLQRRETVSDEFFDELFDLLRRLHERDIAYVDLNKRQNILMGEDGRPYLIDFQISLHLPPVGWRRAAPVRWLLRRFQRADWYHVLKHKRRLRPDLLTVEERRQVERIGFWIRLHRVLTRPLLMLRRRTLRQLQSGDSGAVVGSDAK